LDVGLLAGRRAGAEAWAQRAEVESEQRGGMGWVKQRRSRVVDKPRWFAVDAEVRHARQHGERSALAPLEEVRGDEQHGRRRAGRTSSCGGQLDGTYVPQRWMSMLAILVPRCVGAQAARLGDERRTYRNSNVNILLVGQRASSSTVGHFDRSLRPAEVLLKRDAWSMHEMSTSRRIGKLKPRTGRVCGRFET
jgi:hypothetical protein